MFRDIFTNILTICILYSGIGMDKVVEDPSYVRAWEAYKGGNILFLPKQTLYRDLEIPSAPKQSSAKIRQAMRRISMKLDMETSKTDSKEVRKKNRSYEEESY